MKRPDSDNISESGLHEISLYFAIFILALRITVLTAI